VRVEEGPGIHAHPKLSKAHRDVAPGLILLPPKDGATGLVPDFAAIKLRISRCKIAVAAT